MVAADHPTGDLSPCRQTSITQLTPTRRRDPLGAPSARAASIATAARARRPSHHGPARVCGAARELARRTPGRSSRSRATSRRPSAPHGPSPASSDFAAAAAARLPRHPQPGHRAGLLGRRSLGAQGGSRVRLGRPERRSRRGPPEGPDFITWLFATDRYGNRHANGPPPRHPVRHLEQAHLGLVRCVLRLAPLHRRQLAPDHVHISFTWAGANKKTSFWTGKVGTRQLRRRSRSRRPRRPRRSSRHPDRGRCAPRPCRPGLPLTDETVNAARHRRGRRP